jgi:hypothetical protein
MSASKGRQQIDVNAIEWMRKCSAKPAHGTFDPFRCKNFKPSLKRDAQRQEPIEFGWQPLSK